MSGMIIFITVPLIFLLLIIYLQVGTYYKIYARKQDQSSRNRIVTGAGIVFALVWLIFFALNEFVSPMFTLALFAASLMDFADDKWEVPLLLQLVFHLILFALVFSDLNLLKLASAAILIGAVFASLLLLLVVSKHDGVNGLLTVSALIFFGTAAFLFPVTQMINVSNPVLYIVFGLIAFGWYNLREKAQLFMGASGRIALSYLMLFLMSHLVFGMPLQTMGTENSTTTTFTLFKPIYLLFFAVMGFDFLQAILRNVVAKKPFNQLPFLYTHLKERQLPFYAIVFIYALMQILVNVLVVLNN